MIPFFRFIYKIAMLMLVFFIAVMQDLSVGPLMWVVFAGVLGAAFEFGWSWSGQ